MLILALRENKEGLKEEGIFRKSANIEDEEEIMNQLMDDQFGCLDHIKNPHIISSTSAIILDLIKRFLAKL